MKVLADSTAKVNILVSWFWSSSSAPIPYESIMITLIFSPSGVVPLMGVPQHHNPLVQALIVLPTPKPLLLFNSILFSR